MPVNLMPVNLTPSNLITEGELQNTLVEACWANQRKVFHTGDSRKQVRGPDGYELVGDTLTRGYPDLTIGGREGVIWAELKSAKGRLDQEQVEWLDNLPAHQSHVWQPSDLEEAMQIIASGHPKLLPREETGCRTCWTCSREEILQRVKVRKRRPKGKAGRSR